MSLFQEVFSIFQGSNNKPTEFNNNQNPEHSDANGSGCYYRGLGMFVSLSPTLKPISPTTRSNAISSALSKGAVAFNPN